eukprot:Skav224748  [mRNA]  locus=scaffold580:128824:137043:- [translate_table: standard]
MDHPTSSPGSCWVTVAVAAPGQVPGDGAPLGQPAASLRPAHPGGCPGGEEAAPVVPPVPARSHDVKPQISGDPAAMGPSCPASPRRARRFRPGEYLARQGDVGRELNIVKSGTCRVLRKALGTTGCTAAGAPQGPGPAPRGRNNQRSSASPRCAAATGAEDRPWCGAPNGDTGTAMDGPQRGVARTGEIRWVETRTFRASVVAEDPGVVVLSISRPLAARPWTLVWLWVSSPCRGKRAGNVVKRMPHVEHIAGALRCAAATSRL